MPYWQLFYHAVWATKDREPLLTTCVAEAVYGHVLSKATGLGGVVYAIGGVRPGLKPRSTSQRPMNRAQARLRAVAS